MPTFSKNDLDLLGYSDISEISPQSMHDRPWRRYRASVLAGVQRVTHDFVYLQSTCSLRDVQNLHANLSSSGLQSKEVFFITPRSGLPVSRLRNIFGRTSNVSILEDLVLSKLSSLFYDYISSLKEGIIPEKYYVAPRSEDTQGSDDRLDRRILEYLRGRGGDPAGSVHVISASAAVGKTTLAREVVSKLIRDYGETPRIIPTFVESSHWGKLQLESVDDLWEIISNSLRNFSSGLAITEDLFEHALKQGYLVFVFDGFDELCTQRYSRFSAREVLDQLVEIAKETEARIVITTRTLFWEAEIGDTPECVVMHRLRPFEGPQAKDYFHKYFGGDTRSASKARTLYGKLIRQSQRPRELGGGRVQFANLPICAGIIAQHIENEGDAAFDMSAEGTIVDRFLQQILQRECVRQNLSTPAHEQLKAFEQIAVEQSPTFDLELLCVAGFNEADIQKLNVHPLLHPVDNLSYKFRYAFLESYFLASYLAKTIRGIYQEDARAFPIMSGEANGKGYVMEHLVELLGSNAEQSLHQYFRSIPVAESSARSFLFHVAKTVVEGHIHRTNALFQILVGGQGTKQWMVDSLFVVGIIDKLDLSNIEFNRCTFLNVNFIRCRANEDTKFLDCKFSGDLLFDGCAPSEWSRVQLKNCSMDRSAELAWGGIRKDVSSSHRGEMIQHAMYLALSKFWHHGRFKASISASHWRRGPLGHTEYCQTILEEMLKQDVLMKILIGGLTEGGYAFNREVLPDLQRFMDNRQMTGRLLVIYQSIMRKFGKKN